MLSIPNYSEALKNHRPEPKKYKTLSTHLKDRFSIKKTSPRSCSRPKNVTKLSTRYFRTPPSQNTKNPSRFCRKLSTTRFTCNRPRKGSHSRALNQPTIKSRKSECFNLRLRKPYTFLTPWENS